MAAQLWASRHKLYRQRGELLPAGPRGPHHSGNVNAVQQPPVQGLPPPSELESGLLDIRLLLHIHASPGE